MERNKKKKYKKPKVTRINLDARTAVLGFCRTTGSFGPFAVNCGVGMAPCSSTGS